MNLREPWLVAVWPGMGGIAQIAGGFLVDELGAQPLAEISAEAYFDVRSIKVSAGLAQAPHLPASSFFGWKNPAGGRDLVIFIGEEQPADGYRFCNEMLSTAVEFGVSRVFTFAAMASPIRPGAAPRVFAAVTRTGLLQEIREQEIEVLEDAEIRGLNGVLLAAAAERDLGAVCLLGEFPFFARSAANPKASAAVLRKFAGLAGVPLDLTALDERAANVESMLEKYLQHLEHAAEDASDSAHKNDGKTAADLTQKDPQKDDFEPEDKARIEALFQEAADDRSKALELKAELDRHGVFAKYEDRFLDLFRQAD